MTSDNDSGRAWQALEKEGDRLWEAAFWADTLAESHQHWSRAGEAYQKALGNVFTQDPDSLAAARLNRKVGGCHRKNGELSLARGYLDAGERVLKKVGYSAPKLLEKARLGLEIAYCYYTEQNWTLQRREAEDIIKICSNELLQRQPELWSILGNAYNLLGIALGASPGTSSEFCEGPDRCWQKAKDFFGRADDSEGERGRHDLMINRAKHMRRRGNCDCAIQILEGVVKEKLTPQRAVLARDNLAVAYLDRLDSGDLDKAISLAEQNVEHAEEHQDLREWIWALEVRLKAMKEQIRVFEEEAKPALLEKATALYNKSLGLIQSEKLSDSEDRSARLELHRIMAEIYMAAGRIENARGKMELIESEWGLDLRWDTGDLFLTRAMFDREERRWAEARQNLQAARGFFRQDGHLGMEVETLIELARVLGFEKRWDEAETKLDEAKHIAQKLECQQRRQRIEDLRAELGRLAEQETEAIEVFFSYAHEDEELRNELEKHLSILKREGLITSWSDHKISPGKEWEGEIDTHLHRASVILLLVSPDFMASDYCWDVEVKRAMERHEAGEARVIPVILRPVDWQGAPFGKLQALPKDAKPVTRWPDHDEALLNVAQGIRAAVMELRAKDNGSDPNHAKHN